MQKTASVVRLCQVLLSIPTGPDAQATISMNFCNLNKTLKRLNKNDPMLFFRKLLLFLLFLSYRHILASLHFNENVKRTPRSTLDGKKYYRVTYPKFKLGEEAVKEVPVPPTYGKHCFRHCIYFTEYVDNIGQVLFTVPFEDMKSVFQKYSANVPEPLNRQFPERKCKDDAVKDFEARKKNTTPLFPPGNIWYIYHHQWSIISFNDGYQ